MNTKDKNKNKLYIADDKASLHKSYIPPDFFFYISYDTKDEAAREQSVCSVYLLYTFVTLLFCV